MDTMNLALAPYTKKCEDSSENAVDFTTFYGKIKADQRPLSTRWMSDKLIADTRRVWSEYLAKPVSEAEAIEMLTNVRHFALALIIDDEVDDKEKGKNHDLELLPPLPKEHRDLVPRLLPRAT